MKRALLVAAAMTVLASGCASFTARNTSLDDVDTQLVAAIDHAARSRGVEVRWVNYPQRRASAPPIVVEPILPTGT